MTNEEKILNFPYRGISEKTQERMLALSVLLNEGEAIPKNSSGLHLEAKLDDWKTRYESANEQLRSAYFSRAMAFGALKAADLTRSELENIKSKMESNSHEKLTLWMVAMIDEGFSTTEFTPLQVDIATNLDEIDDTHGALVLLGFVIFVLLVIWLFLGGV